MNPRCCIAATLLAFALSFAASGTARAQWEDDLEAYLHGQVLHGIAGWQGWDNDPAAAGVVTGELAFHGNHSIDISGAADQVRTFTGATAGRWQFRIAQFIPPGYVGGGLPPGQGSYFILLNSYNAGGPYNWSVQFRFDSTDGQIHCDCGSATSVLRPYVTDRWVPIEVVIDLGTNAAEIFYDNTLLGTYPWTAGPFGDGGGVLNVAALDLYANGSSSIYYDYGSLLPVTPVCCPGDMDGNGLINGLDVGAFAACCVEEPVVLTPSCSCADQEGNFVLDAVDVGMFASRLLAGPMCYNEVRLGIPNAPLDPPNVQFFYDTVNRTNYLIGDIPAGVLLTSTPADLLPQVLARLNQLAGSGLVPVDAPAVAAALSDAAALAGPMSVLEVLSMPPGSNPALAQRLEDLRNLGINVPRIPDTMDEAASFLIGHNTVVDGAPDLTYSRYYFSIGALFSATERAAIDTGRDLGIFAETAASDKNNLCCFIGFCKNKPKKFCKFYRVSPLSTATACVQGSDDCP